MKIVKDNVLRNKENYESDLDFDILATRESESYLRVCEHIRYYSALKSNQTRMDFHPHIIKSLKDFLSLEDTQEMRGRISRVIEARSAGSKKKTPANLAKHVEGLFPGCSAVLDIPDTLTLRVLKQAYRQAALRVHPDTGGTHEKMILLNKAFAYLHALAVSYNQQEDQDGYNDEEARTTMDPANYDDLRYHFGFMLFKS